MVGTAICAGPGLRKCKVPANIWDCTCEEASKLWLQIDGWDWVRYFMGAIGGAGVDAWGWVHIRMLIDITSTVNASGSRTGS